MKYLKKYNESRDSKFQSDIQSSLQELIDDGYIDHPKIFKTNKTKIIYTIKVPTKDKKGFLESLDMAIYKITSQYGDILHLRCWDVVSGSKSISGIMYNATGDDKLQSDIREMNGQLTKKKNQFEIIKKYILSNRLKDLSFEIEMSMFEPTLNESLDYLKRRNDILNGLEKEYKGKIDHCLLHLSDEYDVEFNELNYNEDFDTAKFEYEIHIKDIADCDSNELLDSLESTVYRLENELDADCYITIDLNHAYQSIMSIDVDASADDNGDSMTLKDAVYQIFDEYNNYINTDKEYINNQKMNITNKGINLVIKLSVE